MRTLEKLGIFIFWIAATVIFSIVSDIFVGIVLGVWATFALTFAAEKWSIKKSNSHREVKNY